VRDRRKTLCLETLETRWLLAAPVPQDDLMLVSENATLNSGPVSTPTPIHRYSFDGVGGNGTTLFDSVGGAHGVLIEADGSRLADGELILGGCSSNTAGYGDLPNGIVSSLTDLTVEGWYTMDAALSWARVFDFGSTQSATANREITGLGDTNGGGNQGLDYLLFSASPGGNINAQQFEIRNRDGDAPGDAPGGLGTNLTSSLNTEYHFAAVFDADGGAGTNARMSIYRDGAFVAQTDTALQLSNLTDVNNWLGRSNWTGDANFQGRMDEFRLYDAALDGTQVAASFAAGADILPQPLTANDTDPDVGDVISVLDVAGTATPTGGPFVGTSAEGATITVAANGSFTYDPSSLTSLQALEDGDSLVDSFTYMVSDGNGETGNGETGSGTAAQRKSSCLAQRKRLSLATTQQCWWRPRNGSI